MGRSVERSLTSQLTLSGLAWALFYLIWRILEVHFKGTYL